MTTGGPRPDRPRADLYVDTAGGLLAYDLSPETVARLLDMLFEPETSLVSSATLPARAATPRRAAGSDRTIVLDAIPVEP